MVSTDETPVWSKSTEQCKISGDWHTDSVAMMKKGDFAVVLESSYSQQCGWWEHRVLFDKLVGWVMNDDVKLAGE